LDHHQGAHRSYPKVTTDRLLVGDRNMLELF
jgi:hypothetical protein